MGLTCDPTVAGNCTDDVFTYLDYFRDQMISNTSLSSFLKKPTSGGWFVECYKHGLLDSDYCYDEIYVENLSLMKTIKNWYYQLDGSVKAVIDGVWGSNSC